MKISVLLHEDGKQIMLTPENEHEKVALKTIAPGDKIEAATKWGRYENEEHTYGYEINQCQGGWFREYPNEDSSMFIITPKEPKKVK